jgi:leader peptidase (prepilin peptidase) / N-methyltransferase
VFDTFASLISATGLLYLLAVAWPLARTDILHRRLPNKYVLPAFPITLGSQLVAAIFFATWWNLAWAVAIALASFGLSLVANRLGFLGMGDCKLMAAMALALGWYSALLPLVALLLTFLSAGVVALALLAQRKIRLGGSMPLGPYLLAGFIGAITLGAWS